MRNRRIHWHIRRSLRQPIPFWIAAVVLTALTATTVGHLTGAAAAERDRWGERRGAVVALHDLEPGAAIGAGDTEVRLLPAGLLPRGAATTPVTGMVVAAFVGKGEVVLTRRLAPAGLSAIAALLPPGSRGVAVPQGPAPLPVEVGDRVDVLATFDPSTTDQPTFAVATGAVVIAVSDDAVTVAVDEAEAAKVAFAVTSAAVTLVLTGVGSASEQPE